MSNPYIDFRARLRPFDNVSDYVYGTKDVWITPTVPTNNANINSVPLLSILKKTNGIVWMYTPQISEKVQPSYDTTNISQGIQDFSYYTGTRSTTISVSGLFTADTYENAVYWLAVKHFLRCMSKSDFGSNTNTPGLPPPTLLFSAYGNYQYNDVPVIVNSYSIDQLDTIDYVTVTTTNEGIFTTQYNKNVLPSNINKVPMTSTITIELVVQKTPKQLRDEFSLKDFKSGKLLTNKKGWL